MPPEDVEPPLLDSVAIEKLREIGGGQGSSFVAEMARLFEEETIKMLEELQEGCDRSDWRAVTRIAHSLKSSSASLGLMRLSAACRALEMDTKGAGSSPETAALVASVRDHFAQAGPILKTLV